MSKKKFSFAPYLIALIIIIALGGLIYGAIRFSRQQTIVTGIAQCPANNICTAMPLLDCNTQTGTQSVSLRCGSNWFARAEGGSILTYYASDGSSYYGNSGFPVSESLLDTCQDGTKICLVSYTQNPASFSMESSCQAARSGMVYLYKKTTTSDLTRTQLTPAGGNEVYQNGGAIYSCSAPIIINDETVGTLTYSGNSPGTASGSTYQLKAGDTITFSAGRLDFKATRIPNTNCSSPIGTLPAGVSKCSGNTLYQCTQAAGQDAVLSSPIDCTATTKVCVQSSQTEAGCFYPQKCQGTAVGDMALGQRTCILSNTQSIYCTTDLTGKPTATTTSCDTANGQTCSPATNQCTYPQTCTFSGYGSLNINSKACLGTILLTCTGNGIDKPTPLATDCTPKKCSSTDLVCENPYTVDVSINGVSNPSPSTQISVEGGSTITVLFKMTEPSYTRRNLVVALLDTSGTTITTQTLNDFTNQQMTAQLLIPTMQGYYNLRVYMSHPDGAFDKTYTIHITSPLSASVASDNPQQFDNHPIIVYARFTQNGVALNPTQNFQFDATFNGLPVNYVGSPQNPTTGKYIVQYNLKGGGSLRVRARAINSGDNDWSAWSDFYEVTVQQAVIKIVPSFQTDISPGSYTFSFQTLDSANNPVDTQNVVTFGTHGSASLDTTPLQVSGTHGSYTFQVTFDTGTLYYIYVSSHSDTLGDTQLNDGHGQSVNVFKTPPPNSTSWLLYVVIAIIIIGFGTVFYFIFRRKKR